jgi:hypothetical protein
MQSEFIEVVTRTFDAQSRINDSFRADMKEIDASFNTRMRASHESFRRELREVGDEFRAELRETNESFRKSLDESAAIARRTDERLDRLAAIVERHVGDGHGGGA